MEDLPITSSLNTTTSTCIDWGFAKQFYQRERQLVDEIHRLNHQVTVTTATLRQAGSDINKKRTALDDLQRRYEEQKVVLARNHEEAQTVPQLHSLLNQSRLYATELKKNLDYLWNAHARMGELVSHCAAQGGTNRPFVDVSHLLLELETKSARIKALEKEKERISREMSEEKDKYAFSLQKYRALQELASSWSTYTPSSYTDQGSIGKRKRYGGRACSAEPSFPEAKRTRW